MFIHALRKRNSTWHEFIGHMETRGLEIEGREEIEKVIEEEELETTTNSELELIYRKKHSWGQQVQEPGRRGTRVGL